MITVDKANSILTIKDVYQERKFFVGWEQFESMNAMFGISEDQQRRIPKPKISSQQKPTNRHPKKKRRK